MNTKVLLAGGMLVAGALTGCAGVGGMISNAIDSAKTPDVSIEACEDVKGQKLADVKKRLFGDEKLEPSAITAAPDGGRDYRYVKGHFKARLFVSGGVVNGAECWKDSSAIPPSERGAHVRKQMGDAVNNAIQSR